MSKRKRKYQKLSIKDILKGRFLVEENAISNWRFLLFLFVLFFVMITSAHWVDLKVKNLNQKKETLDQTKSKYTLIHSKLLKMQLESELVEQMKEDSIFSLEEHPIKIVVE